MAEQWIRAERLQRMGLLRAIHPDELTPEGLIAAVAQELARGEDERAVEPLEMDGLARIGQAMAELTRVAA